MIQIVTDNETQKFTFNCTKILVETNKEELSPVNKDSNTINISYDDIKKTFSSILLDKEKKYIKRLCEEKQIKDVFVKMSNGDKKKINGDNIIFGMGKNSYYSDIKFRFNDKLDIVLGGKEINIDEFKKICESKKIKIECEFKFYSVIYKTQEKTNIMNRMKILNIKILEMFGEHELIQNYKNYDCFYDKKKYTTSKKTAVNNIMKLLIK
jgi:hypothetical protein